MNVDTHTIKPRVSPSQIATFRLCPRKWAFSRILPGRSNPAAELGTAVHTALEQWLLYGTPLDLNTRVGRIGVSGIEHLPAPGVCDVESAIKFETEHAIYTGRRDIRFRETRPKILAVDAAGAEVLKRIAARGGVEVIGDHKTTSSLGWAKKPDELATDPQGVIYAQSVFEEMPHEEHVELRWVYYTTSEPHKSRRVSLIVHRDETRERIRSMDETSIRIGYYTGVAPHAVPTVFDLAARGEASDLRACEAFGGCPYQNECGLSASERMKAIMSQSALQEKIRAKLAAKNGGATPAPAAASAPVAAPASAETPKQTAAEKIAAMRAAKEAKAATPAEPAREQFLEKQATEKATTINVNVETTAPAAEVKAAVEQAVEKARPQTAREKAAATAIPVAPVEGTHLVGGLRDQLAMSALNGIIARGDVGDEATRASAAYAYADAMLRARG